MSRLSLLVDLSSALSKRIDLDTLLDAAATRIADALDAERATIWISDPVEGGLVTQIATLPEVERLVQPLGRGVSGTVAQTGERLLIVDVNQDPRFDPAADTKTGFSTKSMIAVPIVEEPGAPIRGVLQVLNKRDGTFSEEDLDYVATLGTQLAHVFSLTSLHAERKTLPGLRLRGRFNQVIGRSTQMDEVYRRVMLAAETDATVLLTGETGTGKGVFARAIHDNSPRQASALVTLDATTLPAQLVESELFGHERGAFTGATRRVQGKVELAQGGTLFIDEIGELPLESQGKLLRLLQERRFERVGGRETLESNARVICATHRDLRKLVREGTFREDLLYRVKVVEIRIPALRQRGPDEIALLADHFGRMYARRYGRPEPEFDSEVLESLFAHEWPGNVRELEHWVESSVVLNPDGQLPPFDPDATLPPSLAEPQVNSLRSPIPLGLSLEEVIHRYVAATLEESRGNKTEAARALGISRNRLARLLEEPEKDH